MFGRALDYLNDIKARQRIAIALAKGGAAKASRTVDPQDPRSWEFSGFSQNGEDGVVDVLRRQLTRTNRYIVEIGAADGTENNSSWLLLVGGLEGLLIEGDPRQSQRAWRNLARYSIGSKFRSLFVTLDEIDQLREEFAFPDPDFFSLDIDGNDYHIAKALFESGFRPKIACVEYNSALGPDLSATSIYRANFRRTSEHPTHLCYGVSIAAWRKFFSGYGYRFITVESHGVNAFFVDPTVISPGFIDGVMPIEFVENRYQLREFGCDHAGQFAMISDQPLMAV